MMSWQETGVKFIHKLWQLLNPNVCQERQHLQDLVEILQEPSLAKVVTDRNRAQVIAAIEHHHLFADESFTDRRIKFFIIATHLHDALLASANLPLERDWSTKIQMSYEETLVEI
jgi:hypothetical protein